jgi:hypothetical protein
MSRRRQAIRVGPCGRLPNASFALHRLTGLVHYPRPCVIRICMQCAALVDWGGAASNLGWLVYVAAQLSTKARRAVTRALSEDRDSKRWVPPAPRQRPNRRLPNPKLGSARGHVDRMHRAHMSPSFAWLCLAHLALTWQGAAPRLARCIRLEEATSLAGSRADLGPEPDPLFQPWECRSWLQRQPA